MDLSKEGEIIGIEILGVKEAFKKDAPLIVSKATRGKVYQTIEGRILRRKTGPATIRYDGAEADVEVVFGADKDAEVLGVTALESMGFQVDPVSTQLRRSSILAL